ncbi:MAG TPA: hypothetical protein VGI63_05850 [Verrucomicrobiae bacterium]|jgi:hypothetical protein
MNTSKFALGFGLVLIGLAIASGVNYLDMRQFESQVRNATSIDWKPSDASVIYQGFKFHNESSQKYFSPQISTVLLDDYSRMDESFKNSVLSRLQNITDSVSQKKAQSLKNMIAFFSSASLCLMNYSIRRKPQNKKSVLAGATT